MLIVLTGSDKVQNKNYDKIFKILDKYSFILKSSTLSEKETNEGYEIIIDNASHEAKELISAIKNVEIK